MTRSDVARLLPAALTCVAFALRTFGLDQLPLWVDEAFTWRDARRPLADIVGARVNVHPPLYGLVMHVWLRLAGESEYALRLPSALGAVLAVPALWTLARRMAGTAAGGVAAALICFAPLAVTYGRDGRMYGPLIALSALVLVAADRARSRPALPRWSRFVILSLAAILTHYTGIAPAVAGLVHLLVARTVPRRKTLIAGLVVALPSLAWAAVWWRNRDAWAGLVWLPWTPYTRPDQAAVDWITAVAGFARGPYALAGSLDSATAGALAVGFLLIALVVIGAWWTLRRGAASGLMLVALAAAPPIGLILLESLRPGWHMRFTLVSLPAVFVLAAIGAVCSRRAAISAPLALLLVGAQVVAVASSKPPQPDDWRAVAAEIRRSGSGDDVALGGVQALVAYYLEPAIPVRQRPVAIGRDPEEVAAELDRAVGHARVVWIAPSRDGLMDPSDLVGTILARYASGNRTMVVGGVEVSRLELRPRDRISLGSRLRSVDAVYGEAVRLTGYAVERQSRGDDSTVSLSLEMRVERPLGEDYKVFAHLLDQGGSTVAQRDELIYDTARQTTSRLAAGTRLRLELTIVGPRPVVESGRAIGVGLYQASGAGSRLRLAPASPEDRLILPLDA